MPKTKISEFSATPANNTDIDSINIAEGCAPSGINDAIRELMAQLKDFQTGAVGDSFNGPVGTSTAAAGAFTTLSSTGNTTLGDASGDAVTINGTATFANANPTLTAGTANGVTYLNGSKVLTSGSALTFDGTTLATTGKFGITGNGSAPTASALQIGTNGVGSRWLYNVPTGGEHNFTENGTVLSWQNLSSLGYLIGGTEQMRLTSTGLGIGTSSPQLKFVVSNGGAQGFEINPNSGIISGGIDILCYNRSAAAYKPIYTNAEYHVWATSTTERMRLDSAGNLGLGVTSITPRDSGARTLELYGTSSGRTAIKFTNATSGTGATDGMFLGYDDNLNFSIVNNESGVITFGTSNTERARIDSSGNLLVGTTSAVPGSPTRGNFYNAGSASAVVGIQNARNVSGDVVNAWFIGSNANNTSSYFLQCGVSGVANVFYIYGNGNVQNTNNSYGGISDVKLKENIVDASPKLADLMQVKVRNYNLIGSTTKQIGVVAQELETIFPAMVDETPDRDAENNVLETTTKSVKYSVFVPMLIKAIQEQQAIIESLKARLDAANL